MVSQLPLDEDVVTYERTQVVAEDGEITYAGSLDDPYARVPISEHVGCTYYQDRRNDRLCAFEATLAERNITVITGYSSNLGGPERDRGAPYNYFQLHGEIYEPTIRYGNTTREVPSLDAEMYPMYLAHDRVDPEMVLDRVSIPVEQAGVPDPVGRAAKSGEATTRDEVEVPPHPIELEDGRYYRVYRSETSDPPTEDLVLDRLGRYLAPLLGLGLLYVVAVGKRRNPGGGDPSA